MSVCVAVDVDGVTVLGRFVKQPTPEELDAFRDLMRAARASLADGTLKSPQLTDEQQARRDRIHERVEEYRLRERGRLGERRPGGRGDR